MKSQERLQRFRIHRTANFLTSVFISVLSLGGMAAICFGVWRLSQPIDERTITESTAMVGLVDMGRSLIAQVARVVQPAIDRTNKLAQDEDVIDALRDGDVKHETQACNHAVLMSTEVDAVALFDRQGSIKAINSVYASGEAIAPRRIDRALATSYNHREIVQQCIRNGTDVKALEFQTACTITPALFDSTGLSIAYSVPVLDPNTGEKIGVISSRIRFDRVSALIKGRSIGGAKNSVEFVTDSGGYFSEDINSGRLPAPIPTTTLSKIVDPLIRGGTDYCIAQYGTDHVGLFRLKRFNTLDGGGIVVMLIGGKDWLAGEARKSVRLQATAITATGLVLLLLTLLLSVNHRLRESERKSVTAQQAADLINQSLQVEIAQRKRNEDSLRHAQALLGGVLGSSLDGVMAFESVRDSNGNIIDFRWLLANPAAEQSVGFPEAQLLGRLMLEVLPGLRSSGLFEACCEVVNTNSILHIEHLFTHNNQQLWLEVCAVKLDDGFSVTFADIHERKENEAALREREAESRKLAEQLAKSEAFARSTVDALSAHIAILDENATIVAVNKAWGASGVSNSKVAGSWGPGANYLEACHDARGEGSDDGLAMADGIKAVIRGERTEFALEYACHAPGEKRWFVGTVTRFPGEGPVHVVVQHQNITHLVLIKEQLKTAKEAAETATRLKSEFLANMSHEIRTPITAILGFSDLMLDQDQTQQGRIVGLNTIRRNAKQLLDLINEILDLSKIEAGRMTVEEVSTDLQLVLSDVCSMMRPRATEKRIELNLTSVGPVPRRVMTDPLRATQILTNLVTNAVKFTERGQVEICVFWEPADQLLCFEVNDTGIGIAEDQIDQLFLPFTQADSSTTRRFGGTGLGLTISRRLAQLLGGDINARSTPGVGSTFTAKIKAPADGSGQSLRVEETSISVVIHPPANHGKISGKILLAEDGKDNQLFISAMLRKAGAEVAIAGNGRIAVEKASSETFDLILMDMQMPELDGYAAASELRQHGFTQPIIALTAHAMADDRAKCINSGCTDYLTKPIDRKLLIETVGRFLKKAQPISAPNDQIVSTLADDGLIAELLPSFIEHLPEQVALIKSTLAENDLSKLRLAVHRMKGAGGSYGFECLTSAAALAESSLRQNESIDLIKQKVDSLVELVRSVRGYDTQAEVVTLDPAISRAKA